jgi:ABC-2 type transport system permease protein
MTGAVVRHLIVKDWHLYRPQILFTLLGGAIALALSQWRSEPAIMVGTVWFFVSLILVACILPLTSIVNERKKQTLAFVMSLPVSPIEYSTAKLIANLAMFLIPWLTLMCAALLLIETRGIVPRGVIPLALILAFLPLVGFCLITATALVGETEGWGIAANVVVNSSYWLVWYFLTRIPALMANANAPAPVWNATAIAVLAGEFVLALLILGVTFFLQSRKRDFV